MLVYIKPLSMFPKIHSDRLFGAFLSVVSEIFPSKLDEIIGKFENNNPPFLISSTFPVLFIDDEKKRFFPKIIVNEKTSQIDESIKKDFKKVDYVEEDIFFDLINGKLSQEDILLNYGNYTRVSNLLMSMDYVKNLEISNNITPHNAINRLSNETEIFYNEGLVYGKQVGLFFFIEILDESYEVIIKSCLKFLKDRGLGRDISTGKGHFDYEIEESSFNLENTINLGDKFITLSRFIPSDEDLMHINDDAYYELGSKRSIDKSGDIRKQVKFFKEGSTFLHYNKFYGKIVGVGNYKPAIEYGYAFPIKYVCRDD